MVVLVECLKGPHKSFVYVYIHLYTHTCMYIYIYIYIYTRMHVYVHTYINVYVYIYICAYVYKIYTCLCIHTCMYICIYTYIYIHIYIYIYINHSGEYTYTFKPQCRLLSRRRNLFSHFIQNVSQTFHDLVRNSTDFSTSIVPGRFRQTLSPTFEWASPAPRPGTG